MKRIAILWARVVAWYGLISALSAMPSRNGHGPNFESWGGILYFLSRKASHILEYAILMIFLHAAIRVSFFDGEKKRKGLLLVSFIFVWSLAALDEYHQTFVFGRTGNVMDVFIDSVGASLAFLWIWRPAKTSKIYL